MDDPWTRWSAARPAPRVLHLDSAAAGRASLATLDAVAAHARLEAETGAYVAQQEATPVLDALRADVAGLFGMPADSVAFVESATAALHALLRAWPLGDGARVGVLPVEWGPNVTAFVAQGYEVVPLPADGTGGLDVDAFERLLADDPPEVVHLTQVTSHRGLVQPVTAAVGRARAAGVPVWVDAAQAIGHVAVDTGADAIYATSRKWLTGPRGNGMLAVAADRPLQITRDPMVGDDQPPLAHLESQEAHVAGRVGLAQAVREYLELGPAAVHETLALGGLQAAETLARLAGWRVLHVDSAIVALEPTAGQDVLAVRRRLLEEHRILTTAGGTARAPGDMTGPLLRISPHVDVTLDGLERLHDALVTMR